MERFISFIEKWALQNVINFEVWYYKDSRAFMFYYEKRNDTGEFRMNNGFIMFSSLKESNAYLKQIKEYCKTHFLDYGITVKTIEFLH